MKDIVVVGGVAEKYRKNARHVVVETHEDGTPAKVVCKYKSTVVWANVRHPCGYCGRPLDSTTFVSQETFEEREAIRVEVWKARSLKVKGRPRVRFRPIRPPSVPPPSRVANPPPSRLDSRLDSRLPYNEDEAGRLPGRRGY